MAETKSIPFASLEQKFLQLEEHHALCRSAHQEGANVALLNPNPFVASICQGGKQKGKLRRAAVSLKNYELQAVTVVILPLTMANPFFATTVANLARRRLIVPKGRRGMVELQMVQLMAQQ